MTEEQKERVRAVWQIWQETCQDRKVARIEALAELMGVEVEEVEQVWEELV